MNPTFFAAEFQVEFPGSAPVVITLDSKVMPFEDAYSLARQHLEHLLRRDYPGQVPKRIELLKLRVMPACEGCRLGILNQEGHMDPPYGCLYQPEDYE